MHSAVAQLPPGLLGMVTGHGLVISSHHRRSFQSQQLASRGPWRRHSTCTATGSTGTGTRRHAQLRFVVALSLRAAAAAHSDLSVGTTDQTRHLALARRARPVPCVHAHAAAGQTNDSRPAGRVILDDVNVIRSSTWFSFCFFRIKINE